MSESYSSFIEVVAGKPLVPRLDSCQAKPTTSADPADARVIIYKMSLSDVPNIPSQICFANVASFDTLTIVLRIAGANEGETARTWACVDAILAGFRRVAPETNVALCIENPVPPTVLRSGVATQASSGLRRFLFGVDKRIVALIDGGTLTCPVRFAPRMPEEDEVRLRYLFPALSDYGMLGFI